MSLSLAHPSCCGCLPCLNRRNPERLISPENFNDVADAAEVVSAERPSASVPALNGSRSPEHTGVLVAGQSKRLDCEALISQIPCGLALTAEKTSGPAPVGFAGKAGSVSGAPRVYASWIDDDPSVVELEFLDDKEDPLAPAKGVIFAACMGAVMGGFIVLCVIALFQRVIH